MVASGRNALPTGDSVARRGSIPQICVAVVIMEMSQCDNVTDDEDIEGTDESSSDELEDEEVVECS